VDPGKEALDVSVIAESLTRTKAIYKFVQVAQAFPTDWAIDSGTTARARD
jgi:hypothetical protein